MINDYLGLPREVDGIQVYPIKVLEWKEFEVYANQFLLYGKNFLRYKLKANKEVKLFDLIISIVSSEIINGNIENEDLEHSSLFNLEKMFSMVLHKQCRVMYDSKNKSWLINFDGGKIDRDNYDVFRQNIMEMNLIHEPIVAPNELSQKLLDDAIKTMSKGGGKVDLEAMIVYVCTYAKISPSDFEQMTYYQLRAQFEMCQRIQFSNAIHLYRSQGAKVEPLNVAEELSIHENPYSFDKLVKKVDKSKEERTRKALGT